MTPTDRLRIAALLIIAICATVLWLTRQKPVVNRRLPAPKPDDRSSIERHRRMLDTDGGL